MGTGAYAPGTTADTYDFTGGAHGSLVSNSFSLEGYSAGDLPTLYFNYFLDTEQARSTLPTNDVGTRDSFRVYLAGSDGSWKLLGTNNTATRANDLNDESDPFLTTDPTTGGTTAEQPFSRQITFDGTPSWRQARIDLSPYVGRSDLRLRFEFDTAGGLSTGGRDTAMDLNVAGNNLQAVSGSQLHDGDLFTVTDPTTGSVVAGFEFDLGPTITAPTGAAIADGATFTVDGTVYEFDNNKAVGETNNIPNVPVLFDGTETPSQLAAKIQQVLIQNPPVPQQLSGNLRTEANDTIQTAYDSKLDGTTQAFQAIGASATIRK